MITKEFKFSISTQYIGSEEYEIVRIDFEEDSTEDEQDDVVNEEYTQWLFEHNRGGYSEV